MSGPTTSERPGIRVVDAPGVRRISIDHPPINLLDATLGPSLFTALREVADDETVRVVVIESADPEFFVPHADVVGLASRGAEPAGPVPDVVGPGQGLALFLRSMPQLTIVAIAGRIGGGGAEFAAACDIRYGVIGRFVLCQPEIAVGLLPVGLGATQMLPRLVGRGRALEIIVGANDIDAATAERWGWLNRSFATGEDMGAFVDRFVDRVASFPAALVATAKQLVGHAETDPAAGLLEETRSFGPLLSSPGAQARMQAFLQSGGQLRDGELNLQATVAKLTERIAASGRH
jgi:enoyl-CoA hydratase/carnithine racemase